MAVRVHLNCAMSLDGCIGLPGPKPLQLSDAADLQRVHRLRAASDAILVGVGTVLADDPKLTVKWELVGARGKNPLRVVLDARLRTPPTARVMDAQAPTLIFHGRRGGALSGHAKLVQAEVDAHGFLSLPDVLEGLAAQGVRTLMVEGGSTVIASFLRERLVDEWTLYVAPRFVGDPAAPRVFGGDALPQLGLRVASTERLGEGVLVRFARA